MIEGSEEDAVGALCDLCKTAERIAAALETIAAKLNTTQTITGRNI